jgi:hypothetical protein
MNDFFKALKEDLTDRRLRPIIAVAAIALLGAVGYAVLGGGGSSSSVPPATAAVAPATPSGLATSPSVPNTAVAETTEGDLTQHHGVAHDPFSQLPQAKAEAAKAAATSSASTSSSTPSSASSAPTESKGSTETTSSSSESTKPSTPAKPKVVYHVSVLFGPTPPPAPAPSTPLTPYENLKLMAALPSAKAPLVVFRGVTSGGKSATFTLVGEAILHGPGVCLPSAEQCQAIDLKPAQTEQLEYLSTTGQVISYELSLVGISSGKASAASLKDPLVGTSKAGRELLRNAGLLAIPGLRASSQAGVLVFAGHTAAHTAAASAADAAQSSRTRR